MSVEDLGLLFFTTLVLSLLLTPASISFAHYIGAIDHPVGRSVHLKPMPRLGGLGMVLSVLLGIGLFLHIEATVLAFMAGVVVILMTGLADDIYQISPRLKMLGQVLACVLFIELSGLTVTSIGDIFGLGEIVFSGPYAYAFTLLCMVGVINAFNLSDGLDGLAAGVVVIICFFIGFIALKANDWISLSLIAALFGGVLGFLKFNSYPAKLFMGDTGSLMLGFAMASISIILVNFEPGEIKPISVAIILGLPIIDTLWVMTQRMMQGKSPVTADKTHLHHRFLALGVPHAAVVSILYVWVVLMGLLALLVKDLPEYWQLLSALLLSGGLYSILTLCEHHSVNMSSRAVINEETEEEVQGILAKLLGHSMRLFPYVIVLGLSLPILIADSLPESLTKLALGVVFFVVIAFPWRDHHERLNIVCGLFYLCGFTILYAWNISSYHDLNLHSYIFVFGALLLVWSFLKIKFKRHSEVFLTSSFELLLIFISWFIPFVILPAIGVPEPVLHALKLSCLGAIPLLIAMKLVIKRQPHRNRKMAVSLILILGFIAFRSM